LQDQRQQQDDGMSGVHTRLKKAATIVAPEALMEIGCPVASGATSCTTFAK